MDWPAQLTTAGVSKQKNTTLTSELQQLEEIQTTFSPLKQETSTYKHCTSVNRAACVMCVKSVSTTTVGEFKFLIWTTGEVGLIKDCSKAV